MNPARPNAVSRILAWLMAEERRAFLMLGAITFAIITILNVGFYRQRELLNLDTRINLHRVVHGWDGLAWYVWLAAAPGILALIRRFPPGAGFRLRNAAGLLLGSAGIYLVVANLRYALRMLSDRWMPNDASTATDWTTYLHTEAVLLPLDFLTFCGFFAAVFAIETYCQYDRRNVEIQRLQLQSARLQSELAQSQLATLRGQLHPHFLFNSFNAISMLVRQRKNEFAVDMITELSSLLRLAMENIDLTELTLGRELDFVACYLNVERVRFGDKLQVRMEVEPEALACLVPNLLLQPLVENAVKHGISQRVTPGCVRVAAGRRGERIRLEVIDDGPGYTDHERLGKSAGIGLRNTRSRLTHAYGADFSLEITRLEEGGTAVRLDLPWKVGPSRSDAALVEDAVPA